MSAIDDEIRQLMKEQQARADGSLHLLDRLIDMAQMVDEPHTLAMAKHERVRVLDWRDRCRAALARADFAASAHRAPEVRDEQ